MENGRTLWNLIIALKHKSFLLGSGDDGSSSHKSMARKHQRHHVPVSADIKALKTSLNHPSPIVHRPSSIITTASSLQSFRATIKRLPLLKSPERAMICYMSPRHVHPLSIFPHFPSQDLAPFFNLFDESFSPRSQHLPSFQPRFDVREEKDAYHLHGELPGIVQKDVQIEFVDSNTLTIRGRAEREHTSGTKSPEPGKERAIEDDKADTEGARPASASSYQKPTVEDEFVDVGSDDANAAASQEPIVTEATEAAKSPGKKVEKNNERAGSKYWVSERSVGEFMRSFTFAGHVNQDSVKASLKDGILSVVVPKAGKETKRIVVE